MEGGQTEAGWQKTAVAGGGGGEVGEGGGGEEGEGRGGKEGGGGEREGEDKANRI